ncbi:acetyltransferase [Oceanobacillus oncorhynchi subsp. incaldanensis]|uniref:Spermidine N(1)-acetyltransferase n=2 Tax=Oceanobacillus TaxID=182709 RepID=A0A0A1MCI8_9BACI|nr:GNAT family protein [Oceanobacillus oncorhynchi]MDM8102286.1 GNAT family protein [Oceanobacillus oncorhynchi]UUI41559.1 GNAT family N-acetyltransferase [Oceanobacillus oncorhynchi]GIO17697.1 acetyltransferase [Oceanobacillus oncorhynchi subsp. incaldanensis]CEI83080.1 Spermidine N(1)-acetyltransferase [Oceanobacillus oncorhynchi]
MIDLSHKPWLKGEKVTLRPFKEEDFPHINACLTDEEVLKLTGSDMDFDFEEEEENILGWYRSRHTQTDRLDLAIVDSFLDILVGEAVINLYDESTHSMNFRILIGPQGRNRGLGTEATQLLIDYVFKNTTLHYLTLDVLEFNPRARHVYEKIGFVKVGINENELEFEGEWIDSMQMKLTRETWLSEEKT